MVFFALSSRNRNILIPLSLRCKTGCLYDRYEQLNRLRVHWKEFAHSGFRSPLVVPFLVTNTSCQYGDELKLFSWSLYFSLFLNRKYQPFLLREFTRQDFRIPPESPGVPCPLPTA